MRTPPLIKVPSYIHREEYKITPEMRTPPLIKSPCYIHGAEYKITPEMRTLRSFNQGTICIEIPLKWGYMQPLLSGHYIIDMVHIIIDFLCLPTCAFHYVYTSSLVGKTLP